mmetsp:Transcript_35510/g.77730  ORF Transcript_35510/g.77730 Transcript_35510/m.77730 type:complete len:345 (+) Transcript_35510:707-1741(+)
MAGITLTNDRRAAEERARHPFDGRGHRGAEHLSDAVAPVPSLSFQLLLVDVILVCSLHVGTWDRQESSAHVVFEAEVHHLVRLVDHNVVALIEDGVPLVESITESTWGGETDLHALSQLEGLLLRVAAADHAHQPDLRHELAEFPGLLLDLEDELAAGRQDNAVRTILSRSVVQGRKLLDVSQQWKHVRARLTAAGLGNRDEVPVLAGNWDHLHLDGRRPRIAHLMHGLEELPRQGALCPDSHGVGDAATPDEELEILPEDTPVAGRHLIHRLVRPVDLVVIGVLQISVFEGQRVLGRLDEGRDVLPRILRTLGNELLVEAVVLALLADVDASSVAATEEKLWL